MICVFVAIAADVEGNDTAVFMNATIELDRMPQSVEDLDYMAAEVVKQIAAVRNVPIVRGVIISYQAMTP